MQQQGVLRWLDYDTPSGVHSHALLHIALALKLCNKHQQMNTCCMHAGARGSWSLIFVQAITACCPEH